jgi:cytochrome d ubiquinol oxidase subunit I
METDLILLAYGMACVFGAAVVRGYSGFGFSLLAVTSLSLFLEPRDVVPAIFMNLIVGSKLGVIEATYQPMKIAAAEAQWETCAPCSFSVFQIEGGNQNPTPTQIIEIPHLLSVLATATWDGEVVGLNELQAQYEQQYGPGNYVPDVFIQYWSMRVMAYLGALVFLFSLWGAWLIYKGKLASTKWFLVAATWAMVTPFLMNTAGWLLTENGRQPWIVQGLMKVEDGVSPSVSVTELWMSLTFFIVLYGLLAAVDGVLMFRFGRQALSEGDEEHGASTSEDTPSPDDEPVPAMTY